jgi:phosphoribosylglycinamide formyltransferase-1
MSEHASSLHTNKAPIAVLISGNGSNLQAIIDACKDPDYPASIKLVISNKENAYGLARAKRAGIETCIINHKHFTSREAFDEALASMLKEAHVDYVCLAGFMRLLTPGFTQQWEGKIINIHPSLLPAFKGMDAIGQALEAGATETGCTVHHVTAKMDEGPAIIQRTVPILPEDTKETLSDRIHKEEHIAYVEALKKLILSPIKN